MSTIWAKYEEVFGKKEALAVARANNKHVKPPVSKGKCMKTIEEAYAKEGSPFDRKPNFRKRPAPPASKSVDEKKTSEFIFNFCLCMNRAPSCFSSFHFDSVSQSHGVRELQQQQLYENIM